MTVDSCVSSIFKNDKQMRLGSIKPASAKKKGSDKSVLFCSSEKLGMCWDLHDSMQTLFKFGACGKGVMVWVNNMANISHLDN